MEKLTLDIPTLFGDHQVLKLRDALANIDGVSEIYASSAWKQVMITYDPKQVKPADLEKALTDAGYPPNQGELPILVHPTSIKRDPQWELIGVRTTKTNPADLK